jgi:hypothetical protein
MIIDHVLNMLLDMVPLFQRLAVPTRLVKRIPALKLEPNCLIVMHIHVVPAIANEDVHRCKPIFKITSL